MKRNNKKTMYKIIIALVIVSSILSVVFAALSTTLTANIGTLTTINTQWNIQFDTTLNNTPPTNYSTKRDDGNFICSNIKVFSNNIQIPNIKLAKPDDYCYWSVKVKNTGTMSAKLSMTPAPTASGCTITGSTIECGCVTIKIATDTAGSNVLADDQVIEANSTLQLYLRADYTPTTAATVNNCQGGTVSPITYTLNWSMRIMSTLKKSKKRKIKY